MTNLSPLLARLRETAGRATPGPWSIKETSNAAGRLHRPGASQSDLCLDPIGDLTHIATFHPALVLALLGVVEAAGMVDAHYSGSLDHQPGYVRLIREALLELERVGGSNG